MWIHLINKGFENYFQSYEKISDIAQLNLFIIKNTLHSFTDRIIFQAKKPLAEPFLQFFNKSRNPTKTLLEQFLLNFNCKTDLIQMIKCVYLQLPNT